ncbi:patatin-like phospholipase family protein [bacterium]|nr:patatin-like phospholipase family protein [bacterium]
MIEQKVSHKKLGIALGSGGAKGIAHIGVLEVLEEKNIAINEISGSSIGAMIGAAYASGVTIEEMKEIAFSIDLKKLWTFFDFTNPMTGGLIKGDVVEEFLDTILPVKRFEELQIPFKCVATDLKTGEPVIFDTGDLVPAVRASISLPGFFKPYKYQERLLMDGGIVNPVPVSLLVNSEHRCAVVLNEYLGLKKWSAQKINIEIKIRNYLNKNFYPIIKHFPDNRKIRRLNFIKNISTSIDNMSRRILEFNLDDFTPDLVIKPEVKDIATMAFYESNKSYLAGIQAAEKTLQVL